MMTAPPADSVEVRCPCCGFYLGTVVPDGSYLRFPPCKCGWRWTGEAVGVDQRARRRERPGGSIEVKSR